MIDSAMKQSGLTSLEDVKKYIKDGKVKANLFGIEFGIPGFTFRDEEIDEAYKKKEALIKDTATGKFSGSDQIDKVGPNLGTAFSSAFKKKEEEDKDKTSDLDLEGLSKLEEGYKTQKEKDAKEAEANRKALIAAQMKEEKRIREEQANEREARQARQKAKDEFRQDLKEQRNQGNISAQLRGGKAGGDMYKKGGIASKSKKKTMKQGGLAEATARLKAKGMKDGGMVLEIGLRPATKKENKMAKEMMGKKPKKMAGGGMVRGTGAAIKGKGFKGVF